MASEQPTGHVRVWMFLIGVIGAVLIITGAIALFRGGNAGALHLEAFVLILAGLLVLFVAAAGDALAALRLRASADASWRYEQLRNILDNHRQLLETISESTSLSDAIKQIAYRHKEREALHHAIHEDIDKHDYEAAYWLVTEMEKRFGRQPETTQFREAIDAGRRHALDREVQGALDRFEQLLQGGDWAGCRDELARLQRRYPDHPAVRQLPEKIQLARETRKRELLERWKEAVAKDDVDAGVTLLKQLDQYLTPGEAEGYKEIARDVFKKQLQQLGVQFSLHVSDHNWSEALRIGRQITEEFPNTRIAAEVRERMLALQEKAAQPATLL